jgi:hypothetical protein
VLLKVVADTRDIRGNLDPVGQAHPGDLTERRVRLLGRSRVHPRANATLLRTAFKRWRSRFVSFVFPARTDELINCWHSRYILPALNIPITSQKEANRDRNKITETLSIYFYT